MEILGDVCIFCFPIVSQTSSLEWGAAQVFVVSLAWTRLKRNDRQASHASYSRWAITRGLSLEST